MNFGPKVILDAFIDYLIDAGARLMYRFRVFILGPGGIVHTATKIGARLKSAGFNIYIAGNMFLCAILFSFWSKPRETVSGFIGRNALLGSSAALYAAKALDKLYRNETAHCGETALAEDEARFVLYPEDHQVAPLESARPELNPREGA